MKTAWDEFQEFRKEKLGGLPYDGCTEFEMLGLLIEFLKTKYKEARCYGLIEMDVLYLIFKEPDDHGQGD